MTGSAARFEEAMEYACCEGDVARLRALFDELRLAAADHAEIAGENARLRAALAELLTCSLPHDISGQGIIARARAVLFERRATS